MHKFYDEILPNCMDKDDGHARVFRLTQSHRSTRNSFVTLDKDIDEFINQQRSETKPFYDLFEKRYVWYFNFSLSCLTLKSQAYTL